MHYLGGGHSRLIKYDSQATMHFVAHAVVADVTHLAAATAIPRLHSPTTGTRRGAAVADVTHL